VAFEGAQAGATVEVPDPHGLVATAPAAGGQAI
jgi:hypothetical protein